MDALVNGVTYNVTALSNTLVVSIRNGQVNQTLSGVLIDFNPTLVQIQAVDALGNKVYYYVLVPSATAIIVGDLTKEETRVGTIVELGQNNKVKLVRVVEEVSNVTIVSASLSVNGNHTDLSVTLRNDGNTAFRVFGLTLHGEFNATRTAEHRDSHDDEEFDRYEKIHPDSIPFKVNGSSLIPLFGDQKHDDEWGEKER